MTARSGSPPSRPSSGFAPASAGRTLSEQTSQLSRELTEVRAGVLRRPGLVCAELRAALTTAYDGWLAHRLPDQLTGVSLVAVGSYGRGEPSPGSDLDLVLLHESSRGRPSSAEITALAEAIWYPIWDSGIGLDHSVRTADQALAVARDDLKALLGLLELRHVAGDRSVSAGLRERVLDLWRATALARLPEVREQARTRWRLAGEGAFLLEPNLKDSRGCLRDVRLIVALALAQLVDLPPVVRAANADLLDIRGELHRIAGRDDDVLHLQDHDGVAAALGLFDEQHRPDRDEVLRRVNSGSRAVAHALDTALRRIGDGGARVPLRRRMFGSGDGAAPAPLRTPLAADVVAQDGEVVLARDASPRTDAGLLVRAARAAAENGLPLAGFTLDRLAAELAPVPVPWPREIREDFVWLLGTGSDAVPVLEALDLAGLLSRLIPEWDTVRSRAQHNPLHRFTVDRHLLETAAYAARLTRDVERPDLLLVGALLHDIGKGAPGDHSVVGAAIAAGMAARMGFDAAEVAVIVALVRHHLLLPDTATRRDPHDPKTVALIVERVGASAEVLALLHALSIADAHATGPAAWSDWKAGLIVELVRSTRSVLHGEPLPSTPPLDDERKQLAAAGRLAVQVHGRTVLIAAPDAVGVLHRSAGVLALHSLDVRSASIVTRNGMAVNAFDVEPRFGDLPDAAVLRADLARVLHGELALTERLRDKERSYGARAHRPPTLTWFDDAATDATVLEVRTEESIGLLTRLTAGLERCDVDVRSARVSSLGYSVLGAFYLTARDGRPVPPGERARIESELTRA